MKNKMTDNAKSTQRVIKKYPNRRLYDTNTSSYITLAEIKRLVMASELFVVRDAKTGEDLTRSILLQIVLEEEASTTPMFTAAVLSNLIRFYGHAMQGFMGAYLEQNIQTLQAARAQLGEQSNGLPPEMWLQYMNLPSPIVPTLTNGSLEQSTNLFLQMQERMQ